MDIDIPVTDNTALFKARIKMLKMKGSSQRTLSEDQEVKVANSEHFELYAAHSRQIGQHIRELRDLVLEKRKTYLLSTVNVYGHDNFMSDSDRRQCDEDTETAMRQCSKLIRNLEVQVESDETLRRTDEYPHLKAITFLLSVYLENVCRIVAELRALQLKKTQHLGKICRLGNLVEKFNPQIERLRNENEKKKIELQQKKDRLTERLAMKNKQNLESGQVDDNIFISEPVEENFGLRQRKEEKKQNESFTTGINYEEEDKENQDIHHQVDPVVMAQLIVENDRIYEKFTQRTNEIELIESQFAEVQKLQRTFAEKVVEQERDIEIIHDKTIYTLENLDQANEFIREAIKNSASRRVIALFCLIVLTLTLLFLDWYNA
ncbi:unnamed protein product [Bursaphelenchus xylophilus]|uniref:(pine wood nematode) hypothetical protein n=1 Tax=Bursaphelenchus xylophilus TaxID=6326 RepID=A0A1I7RT03_BURXY|nr:unnamed protein product [Bursaphelenchus xylophilus]CAG9122702.1 unnamed protein product [Bursaphelenchus xylophilus]